MKYRIGEITTLQPFFPWYKIQPPISYRDTDSRWEMWFRGVTSEQCGSCVSEIIIYSFLLFCSFSLLHKTYSASGNQNFFLRHFPLHSLRYMYIYVCILPCVISWIFLYPFLFTGFSSSSNTLTDCGIADQRVLLLRRLRLRLLLLAIYESITEPRITFRLSRLCQYVCRLVLREKETWNLPRGLSSPKN